MKEKPEKQALSIHQTTGTDPHESVTPVTPIGGSPLADTILHGSRIYQLMVESVRDYAIFMLDPKGHVSSWNRGAERIKQYTADEIIGHHFSAFYPPEDLAANKPAMELKIAAKEGRFEDEGIRLRKDGTPFWANVIITAVRDYDGTLVGFAKVTRDLTERRAAQEREIANARRLAEVEAANATKSQFLAAMSHELRTPLNAIGGYAELLSLGLGGPVSAEQMEYLERIRRSQQHLLGIISDLLNFTRIEAGHIEYKSAEVPLDKVIESVMLMVETPAAAKGLALRSEYAAGGCTAVGDRGRIDQILLNLVSNAIKYTASGGRITITCAATPTTASITVTDTGRGVPLDKQESIFEPFVQLGRSLSSAHEGMGLGLAISRDMARAMGGNITVASEAGKGSAFTLTVPRPAADSAAVRA